ncbi:MAG: peptide chain release factor N(5)-glutamine methyltransferase [Lachnospiraceae bacterium]|nr:peptide chain release factor N(5)-glutamine methyltransferase [Lachnospiraceae bacterium]
MTYREAVALGEKTLTMAGIADVKTDAWMLLEMAAKIDRNFYYMHMNDEITQEQLVEYESVLKKRSEHIPLQYITGETEFMGLPFKVNSNVLIPRQDTETLVEEALKVAKPGMKVLDMCTGSGCIIISILHHGKALEGYASDISRHAINVAKENAKLNQVAVSFETGDLFDHIKGKYDIIVSNPPYIRTEEIAKLMPEVQNFEPFNALDGKEDGLFFYRKIVEQAGDYLNSGGHLLFEIGHDQGQEVSELMVQAGFKDVRVIKDLAGKDRVVTGGL